MKRIYAVILCCFALFGCCAVPTDNATTPGLMTFAWGGSANLWRGMPASNTVDVSCDELVLTVASLQMMQWHLNSEVTTDKTLSAAFRGVENKFRRLLDICEKEKEKE